MQINEALLFKNLMEKSYESEVIWFSCVKTEFAKHLMHLANFTFSTS